MIGAGALDRRVELLRSVTTTGAAGDQERTGWAIIAEVFAGKDDVSGREFIRAGQQVAERVARFTIRWRDDFTVLGAIRYRGEVWEVLHIAEPGRRERLEITAQVIKGQ